MEEVWILISINPDKMPYSATFHLGLSLFAKVPVSSILRVNKQYDLLTCSGLRKWQQCDCQFIYMIVYLQRELFIETWRVGFFDYSCSTSGGIGIIRDYRNHDKTVGMTSPLR